MNQNSIAIAPTYEKWVDEVLVTDATTQWMAVPNEEEFISYDGKSDTFNLADIITSGMGNYDKTRASGSAYPGGMVTNTWVPYAFQYDRAVKFGLEIDDPDNTQQVVRKENVTKEFTRQSLTPEIELARMNRIYAALAANGTLAASNIKTGAAPTSATIMDSFNQLKAIAGKAAKSMRNILMYMPMEYEELFRPVANNTHNKIGFNQVVVLNGIEYPCTLVNSTPVLSTAAEYLQTVIKINDGKTAGQEAGGIVPDATSKQIHMLAMHMDAPFAVQKIKSIYELGPGKQTEVDGTLILYHQKHGCWVRKNKLATVAALVNT